MYLNDHLPNWLKKRVNFRIIFISLFLQLCMKIYEINVLIFRSSTLRTSSCCVGTTNVPQLTEFTDSTTNVSILWIYCFQMLRACNAYRLLVVLKNTNGYLKPEFLCISWTPYNVYINNIYMVYPVFFVIICHGSCVCFLVYLQVHVIHRYF